MKKLKITFIFAFVMLIVVSCTACKKKDNLDDLSQALTNYNITIDFDDATKSAKCDQTVDYINSSDDIIKEVRFHLYPQYFEQGATDYVIDTTKMSNAYPNGMSYASFDITRVSVQGEDVAIKYSGEHDGVLVVSLNNSLLPDGRVSIYIEYEFTLPNCCHRFGYGDNSINIANFYPIACVYKDGVFNESPYDSNGDPFYSDMANYNVTLKVDNSLTVANTGYKVDVNTDNGKTNYHLEAKVVRDFAIVMSEDFEIKTAKAGDVQIEYYYFNDDNSDRSIDVAVDAINTFSKLYGDYPYDCFSVVETDFVHGGMEYPMLVYISTDIENEDDYFNVIIHETAHQWWYGVVGRLGAIEFRV